MEAAVEATLQYQDIENYAALKQAMDKLRARGVQKVNFPPLQSPMVVTYTIPPGASFIQLTPQVDFKNWTIIAENGNRKDEPLFSIEKWSDERRTGFKITKADVDRGNFSQCPELRKGRKLLVLTDQNEWTFRTDLADKGTFLRHDIIALNDGVPENTTIAQWDTPSTAMSCYYYEADNKPVVIENLTFLRHGNISPDQGIAKLIRVDGKYDVTFRNIKVEFDKKTRSISKTGDLCFEIYNCANVSFQDITVNGTYSSTKAYGYAFYLDTVYNTSFRRVNAMGLWGVIGTRNMNRVLLEDCTLNRFDIHCYGRDVRCVGCSFRDNLLDMQRSNDYSSFYGTLRYEKCTFRKVIPVLLASNYHAYSGFDIILDSCTLDYPNSSASDYVIVKAGRVETSGGRRLELRKTNWPNVQVTDMKVRHSPRRSTFYLFSLLSAPQNPKVNTIGNISRVSVSFQSVPRRCQFRFSNYPDVLVFDKPLTLKKTASNIDFSDMQKRD